MAADALEKLAKTCKLDDNFRLCWSDGHMNVFIDSALVLSKHTWSVVNPDSFAFAIRSCIEHNDVCKIL